MLYIKGKHDKNNIVSKRYEGKGFAVVAGEIGNLVNQTSNTVNNIRNTVAMVKESVYNDKSCNKSGKVRKK